MPIALGELDLDEVLRYMGTPPSQAGPELRALAEECGRAVCAAAWPRWAWRAFDIAEEADGVRLTPTAQMELDTVFANEKPCTPEDDMAMAVRCLSQLKRLWRL